jgi:hypothetical protein
MQYPRYSCSVHGSSVSVFDDEVQKAVDLDLAAPTRWVLKRNSMFFSADFLWYLVCPWHAFTAALHLRLLVKIAGTACMKRITETLPARSA